MLEPLQKSLKSLRVDLWTLKYKRGISIGPFHAWPVLNIIKCPIVALVGNGPHLADVVPTGIRELEIVHDQCYTFEETPHEVRALLMRKQTVVPLLERIAVYDNPGNLGMVERMRVACRAARVELYEHF